MYKNDHYEGGFPLAEHHSIAREAAERGVPAFQVANERAALGMPPSEQPKELREALARSADAANALEQAEQETSNVIAFFRESELLTAKVVEIKGKIELADRRFTEVIMPPERSAEFIAGVIGDPMQHNYLERWATESLASKEATRLKPLVMARLKQELTTAEEAIAQHIKDMKNAALSN